MNAPPYLQVHAGLYRGPRPEPEMYAALMQRLRIRSVISLEQGYHLTELRLTAVLGLEYEYFGWNGFFGPSVEDLRTFLRRLREMQAPVFVHCRHGHERTGMAIAAERIVTEGWHVDEATMEMMRLGFHPGFFWWPRRLRGILNP